MGLSYFKILSRGVKLWNDEVPIGIQKRTFELIRYPRWIWVGASNRKLYENLASLAIPYLGIRDKENTWFVDYGEYYKNFIKPEVFIYSEPIYLKTDNKYTLVYNYRIFGEIDKKNKLDINFYQIKLFALFGINYVITLYEMEGSYSSNPPFKFKILINPRDFSVKYIYLTHDDYDSGDVLTTAFLYRASDLAGQALKLAKLKFSVDSSKNIKTKSKLLDVLDEKVFYPTFKSLQGVRYIPMFKDKDVEKRLTNIKRFLSILKRGNNG